MLPSIFLSGDKLGSLISLANNSLPLESCALLLGQTKGENCEETVVRDLIRVNNNDSSPVSFSIKADDLIKAYKFSESRNLEVVGIFHSHPAEPFPSPTDKRFMKINPVVWLIYSTTKNETRAFIFDDHLIEVRICVME
jgi:proteasome lid subunit RPN8/RPN11